MAEYIEKQTARPDAMCEGISCSECSFLKDRIKLDGCRLDDFIMAIPAADVRPVIRGRWVKKYENPLDGNFYCSNCKGEIDIADGYITPLDLGLYYCHNCGADLREADNGPET